ncbi:Calcipressin-domain-containing protein [Endogone sp. FLAS-F59071]|nr:Calcipressin-domain-containing protein [Endogone sp. FLAS-F59071]|eukprot:RUS21566.1 Calcipressin-domain-containing protein [Endogone sp. FLAS-F59071]
MTSVDLDIFSQPDLFLPPPSALPPLLPPSELLATNTLTLPIPRPLFAHPYMLQHLRDQFEMFGPIHRFIPIKSFARVLVVYEETLHAMTAKSFMDRMVIRWNEETEEENAEDTEFVIRVYFGEHTPINPDPSTLQLAVPDLEKNYLISPPGSPPVGWQQIRESAPNSTILPSDLMHALTWLQPSSRYDSTSVDVDSTLPDSDDFVLGDSAIEDSAVEDSAINEFPAGFIIAPADSSSSSSDNLPTITVHDWDGNAAHDAAGTRGDGSLARAWSRQRKAGATGVGKIPIANTPMPPMGGLGARPPTPTPTAMPPGRW